MPKAAAHRGQRHGARNSTLDGHERRARSNRNIVPDTHPRRRGDTCDAEVQGAALPPLRRGGVVYEREREGAWWDADAAEVADRGECARGVAAALEDADAQLATRDPARDATRRGARRALRRELRCAAQNRHASDGEPSSEAGAPHQSGRSEALLEKECNDVAERADAARLRCTPCVHPPRRLRRRLRAP